ncbi:MAG TPA: hypothetical protein VH281_10265 [Gaiellaceae bacterium]
MTLELCDEFEGGFGWSEPGFLERTSHALEIEGRVFLLDPIDAPGLDEQIGALGDPEAVVQLLDRHERDCAAVAGRLGVPRLRVPREAPDRPFGLIRLTWSPVWREVAFWEPRRDVLVVGDALGTSRYFTAAGEALGVHPLLRPWPPRALAGLAPRHVLCGHGLGIHGDEAALALAEALTTARRRIPRWLAGQVRRKR